MSFAYHLVTVNAIKKHTATVVFLHGLGDSGEGWAETFRYLQKGSYKSELGHVKFICPSSSSLPVTLNMGMTMPAWYDIKGLSIESRDDTENITKSVKNIKAIIDYEHEKNGIPYERIVLGGFSQGGSIALFMGLTFEKKLAGILGMSTYSVMRDSVKDGISANKDTPLLMCHGTSDQVVQYDWGKKSYEFIKSVRGDKNIEFNSYKGLQHSSSMDELDDVIGFLSKNLPEKN